MTSKPRVPDWLLERLGAGELPAPAAAELSARLEASGELSRLSALAASNDEILRAYPAAAVAAEVERRLARSLGAPAGAALPRARWMLPASLALGGAAALVLSLVSLAQLDGEGGGRRSQGEPSLAGAPGEQLTSKGLQPQLSIYRRTATGHERLGPEARVRAGDTLQLAYVAAGRHFGVVASVDALGVSTLHLPEQPGPAARLDDRGETPLPHSFELDATPGFERFVFVTSPLPFDTRVVLEGLAKPELGWAPPLAARIVQVEKAQPESSRAGQEKRTP